jgi:hypothetical protein
MRGVCQQSSVCARVRVRIPTLFLQSSERELTAQLDSERQAVQQARTQVRFAVGWPCVYQAACLHMLAM